MRRIRRLTWVLLVAMLCLLLPSFSAPAMAFTDAKYYIEVDIGNQIVTIYDADVRRQNFGMVSNAFVRIVDDARARKQQAGTSAVFRKRGSRPSSSRASAVR